MRRVVNNAELPRNETPLDRSTFTSFRSTSPSSRDEFPFRPPFLSAGEIVHRSRAAPASLYRPYCIPRPRPPPPFCFIASRFTHRWRHEEISEISRIHFCVEMPFVETGGNRLYPVVCAFGKRSSLGGSSSGNALYLSARVFRVCWSAAAGDSIEREVYSTNNNRWRTRDAASDFESVSLCSPFFEKEPWLVRRSRNHSRVIERDVWVPIKFLLALQCFRFGLSPREVYAWVPPRW